jgi:hypothetical protein
VFRIGVFSKRWMVGAVAQSLALATIHVPFLRMVFGTVALTFAEWLWILPFSLLASIAAGVTKNYLGAPARRIGFVRSVQMQLA